MAGRSPIHFVLPGGGTAIPRTMWHKIEDSECRNRTPDTAGHGVHPRFGQVEVQAGERRAGPRPSARRTARVRPQVRQLLRHVRGDAVLLVDAARRSRPRPSPASRPSAEAEPAAPPISARTAPQPECPHTVIVRDAEDVHRVLDGGADRGVAGAVDGGTMLPTLRTQNRSPGPLVVIMLGTRRESAQVMKSCSGRWPSRARPARCGRTSGATLRSNSRCRPPSRRGAARSSALPLRPGAEPAAGVRLARRRAGPRWPGGTSRRAPRGCAPCRPPRSYASRQSSIISNAPWSR